MFQKLLQRYLRPAFTIVQKISKPQNPGQQKPFSGPPRNCPGGGSTNSGPKK